VYLAACRSPFLSATPVMQEHGPETGGNPMQPDDPDGLEAFDPHDNPADAAEDFADDDRDDDGVDAGAPALDVLVGGGLDG